ERGLAHHPLGQHAPGNGDGATPGLQRLAGPAFRVGVFLLQVARVVHAPEIVRERDALRTQRRQLGAPLGDQMVFVDGWLVGHVHSILIVGATLASRKARSRRSGFSRRQRRSYTEATHPPASPRLPAPTSGWPR